MVSRHTILSTVFISHPDGKGFVQIVVSGSKIHLSHVHAGQEDPVSIMSRQQQPAFLAKEPQHAFTICQSESGEIACRLDINHALVGATSMSILIRDLAAEYDGNDLPAAPPFSAMIKHICSAPRAQKFASWSKLLDGLEACSFPVSRLSDKVANRTSRKEVYIANDLQLAVTSFCKTTETTRSVFVQTAWAMVLSHFTGMHEVCFGYTVSGRDAPVPGVDEMVGPLVNLLISRVELRALAM